jgi:hypothetical protein
MAWYRPIRTPDGLFGSPEEAARHYGIQTRVATRRARKCHMGWSYDGPPLPPETIPAGAGTDAWEKYRSQRVGAKRRGIGWEITFEEWWRWWQIDGRWEARGAHHADALVMARFGDVGPYALSNIYCTTLAGNSRDIDPDRRGKPTGPALGKTVITPDGIFPSLAAAARHHDIGYYEASILLQYRERGWRMVGEDPTPIARPSQAWLRVPYEPIPEPMRELNFALDPQLAQELAELFDRDWCTPSSRLAPARGSHAPTQN